VDEEALGHNGLLMLLLHLSHLLLLVVALHLYSGLLLEVLLRLLLLLCLLIVLLWRHLLLGSLEEGRAAAAGRAQTSSKC